MKTLKKFKIYNKQFGEIEFRAPSRSAGIDLTYVDLAAFEIKYGMVLGYEEVDQTFIKPEINTKLNIPATVTLIFNKNVKEKKLINIIERQNQDDQCKVNGDAEHISYHDKEWIFRVPHWSRYGLDDSDDEDEEETKQIEPEDLKKKM